jgi:hypothetical protein
MRLERRMTPRSGSATVGAIVRPQQSMVECTVRDFSPAGACLLLPDAVKLPPEFDLIFDDTTRHCVRVWRQLGRMGLRFKST